MMQDTPTKSMHVVDFAQTRLLTCAPFTTVAQAAALMRERACSSVLIVEEGRPVGIWTERDAAHIDFSDPAAFDAPIATVMSAPLATITASSDVGVAVLRLREAHIRHLVVVDDAGASVGIITQTDLALRHGIERFLRLRAVGEVIGRSPLRLAGALPAGKAARRMAETGCDAAIVERLDGTLGILTERDLLALVAHRQAEATLGEIASFPLRTVPATQSLLDARRLLIDGHIRHLGITAADGALIGLLSLHDILEMLEHTYAADLAEALHQRDDELLRSLNESAQTTRTLREERDLIAAGPSVVFKWATSTGWPVTYVSPNVAAVFGHRAEDLMANLPPFATLVHPDDLARVAHEVAHYLASDTQHYRQHYRLRHADGGWRWIDDYSTTVRAADGTVSSINGYVIDVTERHQADESLQLAASVFSHAREGIMITTPDGIIVDVNAAFVRITGYSRDEVVGKSPNLLKSGRQGAEFYAHMWRTLSENGYWAGEVWNRRKDGEVYAELLTISAVRNAVGGTRHYVALFSDITAQKEHQQQLEHIAHYDALTGLPNRVLLADRMRQALAQTKRHGKRLAAAYIDLDGFKAINDHHGHEAGDQLLMALANRMKLCLREGDTIARLGGDEFVAVLVDLQDLQASVPLILRLLAAAAQPVECNGLLLQVSASIGVGFHTPTEDSDADQLLRQADQAMYQAKLAGKNRYHVFDAEQDRNVRGHHESIERIRQALTAREFVLYYQPKINLRSGALIGAEALIRWQHPERGLLPPTLFLHEIEDHPLGVELGEWVIDTALAQIETWQTQGLDLPVSVNIAARHLQQPDFVARLQALLASHPAVRPEQLELEVLETSALEDMGHVSAVIGACAQMGIGFALDDFGTGYSSLTYLKRLPARVLKIDQSFVHDMLDDPDDLAILDGVLGLATAFSREAIAEGVETVAHGETLLRLGCELAQGYGIARPMPAGDLPGWRESWRPDPIWAQTPRLSRDLLPVLFAGVEHRAWIRSLGEHLDGKRNAPPPLNHHQCRFGQWLDKAGHRSRAHHAHIYTAIEALHVEVHTRATELLDLHRQGRGSEAHAGLDGLHTLRDSLLAQLRCLLLEA